MRPFSSGLVRGYIPAMMVLIAVLFAGVIDHRMAAATGEMRHRLDVQSQVTLIRSDLEGNLLANTQLLRGLVAAVSTEPNMSQERFATLAELAIGDRVPLRAVTVAPSSVIKLVYPLDENQDVVGMELRDHPDQGADVERLILTGKMVLTGPVELRQGGVGFICRFPIFVDTRPHKSHWGLLSAVMDADVFYRSNGLLGRYPGLDIALAKRGNTGALEVFFGDAGIVSDAPESTTVTMAGEEWTIMARPVNGWASLPGVSPSRLMAEIVLGLLVVLPAFVANYMAAARDNSIRKLRMREAELGQLSKELSISNRALIRRNDELEETKKEIEIQALHDYLTGLPNRRFLDQIIREYEAGEASIDDISGVLLVDLDGFKKINDTFGHASGDILLVQMANALRGCLRESDFMVRTGGDEFVILCNRIPGSSARNADILKELATKIRAAVRQPFRFGVHEARLGISIGGACNENDTWTPETLIYQADQAMYAAKRRGRNQFELYSGKSRSDKSYAQGLSDELLSGIERGEFICYYQPQFYAADMSVSGVEALVRWQHPRRGLLNPAEFLGVAQGLRVEAEMDRIAFECAVRDMEIWDSHGIHMPRVSVNVSAQRLQDPRFMEALHSDTYDRGRIALELLESIDLNDATDSQIDSIRRIKELGVEVEIDDFGTGFASISSLLKLRPDRLKIASQLTRNIGTSKDKREMLKAIVDMARALQVDVCAEGVENKKQLDLLRRLGFTCLQGFMLAKPMPAQAITRVMTVDDKGAMRLELGKPVKANA